MLGDSYDYLAARVAFSEIAHRFWGLTQLVSSIDCRPDLSRLDEVAQCDQILFARFDAVLGELLISERLARCENITGDAPYGLACLYPGSAHAGQTADAFGI